MISRYSSPPDPAYYNLQVWELVRQVPAGQVVTYGQIAQLIPPPRDLSLKDYHAFGARWVGSAIALCPPDVPWHRVINAQGKISQRRGGGEFEQRHLLESEGVLFDDAGRVNLRKYRYNFPSETEHGSK